jgi:hypothetical protein
MNFAGYRGKPGQQKRPAILANVGYVRRPFTNPNTEPKPRRQVMKEHSTFIGMDVHKNSIDIAIADQGRKGRVRHYGKIDGTLSALDKVVRKLVSTGSHAHSEMTPCGPYLCSRVFEILNAALHRLSKIPMILRGGFKNAAALI